MEGNYNQDEVPIRKLKKVNIGILKRSLNATKMF